MSKEATDLPAAMTPGQSLEISHREFIASSVDKITASADPQRARDELMVEILWRLFLQEKMAADAMAQFSGGGMGMMKGFFGG